jgi:multidrug transporter EmrE-like cation transporter
MDDLLGLATLLRQTPMTLGLSLLTLLCVTCISIGQLLFKKAAATLPETMSLVALFTNPWLSASLALYGLTTLGWIWILRHAPLHLAYPFMGLAFLIVPTLAWIFLGEPLHWRSFAGGALIMAGVALASTH